MTRDVPRRPSSSRAPVSRPRRVAGQGGRPADPPESTGRVSEPEPVDPVVEPVETPAAEAPAEVPAEVPEVSTSSTTDSEPKQGLAPLFDSARSTLVLLVVLGVLVLALGGFVIYSTAIGGSSGLHTLATKLRAAQRTPRVKSTDLSRVDTPAGRPVLLSTDDANAAAAAAAKDAQTILTTSYKDYDKEVAAATRLMTPGFAKQFRTTKSDIEKQFVAEQTQVEYRVVGQGVVKANRSQVQALLFLNQYTTKGAGPDKSKGTTLTPYRALVTVVHTDTGWLVSNIVTQ